LFYLYIISDKLVGLTYKGLRKLEAQDRGVKPVEISAAVSGLVNKNIQQFILRTALVTEDKLLFALSENQLFACFSHGYQTFMPFPQNIRGQRLPLFIGLNPAYLRFFFTGGDNIAVGRKATGVLSANRREVFTN
jgi:hypothetical protein